MAPVGYTRIYSHVLTMPTTLGLEEELQVVGKRSLALEAPDTLAGSRAVPDYAGTSSRRIHHCILEGQSGGCSNVDSQLDALAQLPGMAVGANVSWHSHPGWYYGLSKAWLPGLPHAAGQRCTTASTWRELGFPVETLVAKNCQSHGGAVVYLNVTAAERDALPGPSNWEVQPRYTPQALFSADDGQPVFGEIRCVLALADAPGAGLALLYRPLED